MPRGFLSAIALCFAALASAQTLTSPKQFFGHDVGDDYYLSNYQQFSDYWHKLDGESDRMQVVNIGKTAEGRDELMAIVSSPENLKNAEKYRDIAQRLTLAQGLTDEQARQLADSGKAVVWIDGGLHATEILGAQQLIETCWRMISKNDAETKRILNDVIILFVHANPDGMDLCSNWYMRNADPLKRSLSNLPELYEKYAGHDNNRDFYMANLPETRNMNQVMYREWFPQIMYNHHQTGPAGTVMFAPPFRDPFNHNVDPLVIQSLELVGANLHRRMIEEGKPGTTMRTGQLYSTWWNGGLRTTAYFHNIVGLLTETIGSPTPMRIPIVPERLVPQGNEPFPIMPQEWHFKQSIEYEVTANLSVLDIASRYRQEWLYNIYQMGRNAIARGKADSWTDTPTRVATLDKQFEDKQQFMIAIRSSELRDAKAYVIPSDQADFPTAIKFVNTLIENGIYVERATTPFTIEDKKYPANSIIVPCDQAYRAHIADMFEPQDHPNDIPAPGAAPIPPYDSAGWTLAYQMGVEFDRLLDKAHSNSTFTVVDTPMAPVAAKIGGSAGSAGYTFELNQNNAYVLVRRLQNAGVEVEQVTQENTASESNGLSGGSIFVTSTPNSKPIIETAAKDLGVRILFAGHPTQKTKTLAPARVALWDRFGGSIDSGWTRFTLEQFEIPYTVVYAGDLDKGDLKSKFDVIIFPADAAFTTREPRTPTDIPAEFLNRLGSISVDDTVPKLKEFMNAGGRVVTIGSATNLGKLIGLPIEDFLTNGGKPLPRSAYYVPGSVLKVKFARTETTNGLGEYGDVMFDNSPVFRVGEGVTPLAWFDTDKPLRSGWAWGQEHLKDGVTMAEANVGKGKLYLFGPDINFRSQPHGVFKLLFNAIID